MKRIPLLLFIALFACTNNDKVNITAVPDSGTQVAFEKQLPALNSDELKLAALGELMRYQSVSRYLINQPNGTAPATEGCLSYQLTNLPSGFLRAQYKCTWTENVRDNSQQKVRWAAQGTDDFSAEAKAGPFDESANLVLRGRRVPVSNQKAASKVIQSQTYVRSLRLTPPKLGLVCRFSSKIGADFALTCG